MALERVAHELRKTAALSVDTNPTRKRGTQAKVNAGCTAEL